MENTRKTRFNNIYKTTFSSGCGSEPENITFFNHFLHNFIQEKNIKSILDLACGNFKSMNQICNNNPMLQYIGTDISEIIIQHNIEHNIINNNIQFMILDVVKDNISHFTQDLIVFRHVIQHLNYNDAQTVIRNIFNSGCKYLLINHQSGLTTNIDKNIVELGWDNQMYNLNIEPFHLKKYELMSVKDVDKHVNDRGQNECYSIYEIIPL